MVMPPSPAPDFQQHRGAAQSRPVQRVEFKNELILFAVGAASCLQINIGPQLFGTDVLVLLLIPFSLSYIAKACDQPEFRAVLGLLFLWLISQIVSDMMVQSALLDYSRGWAKLILFGCTFSLVYARAEGRLQAIAFYLLGLSAGQFLSTALGLDAFQAADPWKFGYGPAILMSAATLSITFGRRLLTVSWRLAPVLAGSLISFLMNCRSLAGISLLAVSFVFIRAAAVPASKSGRQSVRSQTVIIILGLAIFGCGIPVCYGMIVSQGLLGVKAQEKYQFQNGGGLLDGRSEILISSEAIEQSPIIGHGSWAKDKELAQEYISIQRAHRINVYGGDNGGNDLIPSHSHIFGAWVEAGILGAVFWAWILWISSRALIGSLELDVGIGCFIAYVVISLVWDIFFSPFGAGQRFLKGGEIAVVLWVLEYVRQRRAVQENPK